MQRHNQSRQNSNNRSKAGGRTILCHIRPHMFINTERSDRGQRPRGNRGTNFLNAQRAQHLRLPFFPYPPNRQAPRRRDRRWFENALATSLLVCSPDWGHLDIADNTCDASTREPSLHSKSYWIDNTRGALEIQLAGSLFAINREDEKQDRADEPKVSENAGGAEAHDGNLSAWTGSVCNGIKDEEEEEQQVTCNDLCHCTTPCMGRGVDKSYPIEQCLEYSMGRSSIDIGLSTQRSWGLWFEDVLSTSAKRRNEAEKLSQYFYDVSGSRNDVNNLPQHQKRQQEEQDQNHGRSFDSECAELLREQESRNMNNGPCGRSDRFHCNTSQRNKGSRSCEEQAPQPQPREKSSTTSSATRRHSSQRQSTRRGRLPSLANPVTNAECDRKQSVNTRNPQFVPHAPHVGSRRERPSATQLQSEKMGVRTRKMAEAYGQLTSRKCEKKRDSQRSRPNRRTPVRLSQRQNSTKYDTSPSSSSSSPRSMYCHDDRDSSSRRGGPIAKALREATNSRILTRPHRLSCRRMTGSKALYGPHRSSKRLSSTVVTIAESSGTSGRDVSTGGSGSFNSTKRSRCAGRYNSKRKGSSANSVNRANRPSQHPVTVRRVQGSGGNLCCKTISILQRLCVARRQAHNSRGRAGHGVVLRDSMKSYFF